MIPDASKLAAGNWKTNGSTAALAEVEVLIAGFSASECEVLLRPPATPIARVTEVARGGVLKVGGQDCHAEVSGTHR